MKKAIVPALTVLSFIAFLVLLALKLLRVVSWSWWVIVAPVAGPAVLVFVIVCITIKLVNNEVRKG